MNEVSTRFDYSALDEDTAAKLKCFKSAANSLIRKSMIGFIAEFGKLLSEARELLSKYGEGTFCKWATTEFDYGKSTIYNYVNAWERCLSNGWTNCQNVSPTALYLLSHEDTPKSVVSQALKLAKKQPSVTKADIERLIGGNRKSDSNTSRKGAAPAGVTDDQEPDFSTGEEAESTATDETDSEEETGTPTDYGKCPSCAGTKWKVDESGGVSCAKCKHPWGECVGDRDEDRVKDLRSKTRKTLEAAVRCFDDLQHVSPSRQHGEAIRLCKAAMKLEREWT
jgi:hypothetical protein